MKEENEKLLKEVQSNQEQKHYYTYLQDYCEELQAHLEKAKIQNEEYEQRDLGYRQELIKKTGEKMFEKGGIFGNGKIEAYSVDHHTNLTFQGTSEMDRTSSYQSQNIAGELGSQINGGLMPLSSPRARTSARDDHTSGYGPISQNSPNYMEGALFKFFDRQ